MFADPTIGLVVAQHVNRWLRRRRKPRGVLDHYYRGVRMNYNASYRALMCCFSALMLGVAILLFCFPNVFENKSPFWTLVVKLGWMGITVVAVLTPLQAFREYAVASDDGIVKHSLFGKVTRLEWCDLATLLRKPDANEITLVGSNGRKLKLNLCYDGWQDFIETSGRHLAPLLRFSLLRAVFEPTAQSRPPNPNRKKHWWEWEIRLSRRPRPPTDSADSSPLPTR